MKASEFRIGNLVNKSLKSGNGRVVVGELGPQDIVRIHENTGYFKYEIIPLTEEWLLKFGFHSKYKSVSNHWTKKAELINAGCQLIDPEDENTDKLTGIFYYSNWGIDILYVHQLQNLYFALTGEELVIKENPKPSSESHG